MYSTNDKQSSSSSWDIVTRDPDDQKPKGAIPKYSKQSALLKPKMEYLPNNFYSTVDMINNGFCVCVIMRGFPGSGKSWVAYQLIEATVKNPDNHILSTDKYFINNRGQYKFEPEKLSEAHNQTQRLFTQRASRAMSPLIVDNTNLAYWEMYHYLQVAVQYNYHIEIMEPNTPWKFSEGKLAAKNSHSVPLERIQKMKMKYESGNSLDRILQSIRLEVVREPQMRKVPPLVQKQTRQETVNSDYLSDSVDLMSFGDEILPYTPMKNPTINGINSKKKDIPLFLKFDNPIPKITFDEKMITQSKPTTAINTSNTEKCEQPTQRKSKNQSEPKLVPHCKNCPNENASFAQIRELYANVNDSYLWDFFIRCNGDADWCVNLLCDENLTDQMEPGNDLTCSCADAGISENRKKNKDNGPVKEAVQSPANKQKKAKADTTKQIDLSEWIKAKEMIEKSITIPSEHYPDHVNAVKTWKNGPAQNTEDFAPVQEPSPEPELASQSPDMTDEVFALPISQDCILELDEEFGGGLLKNLVGSNHKFPPKIFIKRSTGYQLYFEIMEAFYSQQEETKLQTMKQDEELAKKLNQEEMTRKRSQRKTDISDMFKDFEIGMQRKWNPDEESNDDIALRMSKEKLVQIFPMLNKDDLMEIFSGADHNFNDTVALVLDSLGCKPEERAKIAEIQKRVFNTPWKEEIENSKNDETAEYEFEEPDRSTSENLRKIEDLRQEDYDHSDEHKICLGKAKEAYLNKSFELAGYYSNIASFHKQKSEEAKHLVANILATIHEKTQTSNTHLDLHFMNLVEAVVVLDTFLDKNISRLRAIKKPYADVFIITGRGIHSSNGVANIKNKTKSRLRERALNSVEANPGLLKVKVYPQSKLSHEF